MKEIFSYHGGHYYDLMDFDASKISMRRVSIALSEACRYGGSIPVSVALHSLIVSRAAEAHGENHDVCHWGLLHDAAEAFTGDLHGGLKALIPRDSELACVLREIDDRIAGRYEISADARARAKRYDKWALIWEAEYFAGEDWRQLCGMPETPEPPSAARALMDRHYVSLKLGRDVDWSIELNSTHEHLCSLRSVEP